MTDQHRRSVQTCNAATAALRRSTYHALQDLIENTCGCKPMFLLQEQHKESGASRAVQAADAWQLRKAKQNQALTSNK